jgi:CubicO group peptidase (beta-lactamase class C family)
MTQPPKLAQTAAEAAYERLARGCQSEHRIPALAVAVHRADRPLWTCEVGSSGTDRPLDAGTQFRLGSVTKTFTAILAMQCRDDGLLDLDDRIDAHIDVPAHGDITIRRILSHTSGLQREPYGDIWDSLLSPADDALIKELDQAERVLANGRRFHYSNLGFALLGQVVAKLRAGTWAEILGDRILAPLSLSSITVEPTEAAATGYLVHAYSDHAWPEQPVELYAVGPAGQLWGTASDLARWAGFLVDPAELDPDGAVIAPATLDEMRWPATTTADDLWAMGFGLGLILKPQPDASGARVVDVGHTGAMPGFLSGVFGRRGGTGRPKALGAAVVGSSSTAGELVVLPHALMTAAVEHDPAEISVWQIGAPPPAAYESVVGRWWIEGSGIDFAWHDGALRARYDGTPAGAPSMVFEPIDGDGDVLRATSGVEVGERLRITRDPSTGDAVFMHLATYRVTRTQAMFGAGG